MQDLTQKEMVQVKQWILQNNTSSTELLYETDLIENRIIDSLQFVEFILFLESITGKEVYTKNFNLESIRSLQAIELNYFKKEELHG
ncbi:hypothetical protein [Paenibacillus amylolyticus]|uniref:hypothetical protein n=1 Tax=Paenibacillus amylolyticus TaxID=1451 RepID=UPI003EB9407A